MIPVVCDKLCMYNKILKAATRKTVQRDALKTLQITQNSKKCLKNLQEGRNNETEKSSQKRGLLYDKRKIPWRRKWQPTPIFLPGKSHGQRILADYSPWGHKDSDTTEHALTHIKNCSDCAVCYISFLALNNFPLYGCTIVDLSIHLLKDILVASKFGQLE